MANKDQQDKAPAAEAPKPAEEASLEGADFDSPKLGEVNTWQGAKLDEQGGQTIGKVEGVYVDDQSGEPEWLLSRMGRFGHYCLVPARDAVGAAGRVWVPYSRDAIRRAPRIEPPKPLERSAELTLLEHYGIATTEAGRGAAIADRGADAVTARPA